MLCNTDIYNSACTDSNIEQDNDSPKWTYAYIKHSFLLYNLRQNITKRFTKKLMTNIIRLQI